MDSFSGLRGVGDPGQIPEGNPTCTIINPDEQKFLFIVDQSGSNRGMNGNGNDAEEGKPKRVGSILNFYSKYVDVPEFSWSLITFQGEPAVIKSRIRDVDGQAIFTSDENAFLTGVEEFRNENDGGYTPYNAAVTEAKNLLEAEIAADGDESVIYNVFFLSDGFPTDNGGAEGPITSDSETLNVVKEIAALKPGRVFFNTAYYALSINDPDRLAADGLRLMSDAGNGFFIDIPGDYQLDFDLIREDCAE